MEVSSSQHWVDAMNKEMDALYENGTWDIVDLPPGRKAIDNKWVYRIKYLSSGAIERYKARLVAKGFNQKEGIDYDETFSPVVKIVTVRCLINLAVQCDWPLFQLDINNAFLYGDLTETVYMKLPDGYFDKNDKRVCKLKKSLYGLKQAPRQWNAKLTQALVEDGFVQSKSDYSLFTKADSGMFLALLVYVDDIIITGNSLVHIENFKTFLKSKFQIKDLGKLKYFLGIEVVETDKGLCLSQRKYCLDLLSEFGLLACKPSAVPLEQNLKVSGSIEYSSSLDVTAGNQDDDGVATDKSLNKASLESGNTPRDDHVEPNVENTRPNTTGPSVVSSPAITTSTPARNEVDVVVPAKSIRAMGERFANTAYGFFLGKRVAYPVVSNYVRNTWGKDGLVKSMLNSSTGLFSFQFNSMDGLDAMLKNGPWFIRNNPLILKKWNPDVNLLKEDVGNVLVWVKLHGVPVTAFSEDGLSAIATRLGTPLMLYSYTSDMCMQSWGRSSYARAMIELWADVELKDTIVNECPKNIGSYVAKNLKNPSQDPRGVPVGPKVSNPIPFDVLISVQNDVDLDTNGGISNLASKEANSSGSSFWNVESSSSSTTPIESMKKAFQDMQHELVPEQVKTQKIQAGVQVSRLEDKDVIFSIGSAMENIISLLESLWVTIIIDGKVYLVDDEGQHLKKVDYLGDHDSEDEFEPVDNEMTSFMASESGPLATVRGREEVLVATCYVWPFSEDNKCHDARPRLRPAQQRPAKKSKSDATVSTGGSSALTQFGELMELELRLKGEAAERAFEAQAEKRTAHNAVAELRVSATKHQGFGRRRTSLLDSKKQKMSKTK
ncbi:ribonuclease H-like domain-containing protein [Tanacetum coccineum]